MKKYMIGFFSVLILLTGCLFAGYEASYQYLLKKEETIKTAQKESHTRSIEAKSSSAKNTAYQEDSYYLKELQGYVAVYLGDGTTLYEVTDLSVDSLPEEIQQTLKTGIYMESASALYGFLENYSS